MKEYYVQYHKAEELGLPNKPFYDHSENSLRKELRFFTSKKMVQNTIGSKCFLIVGFGKKGKMDFYLWNVINIENVSFKDSFFWAEGSGIQFKNPIYLNNIENFIELKNYTGNFGLGFTNITSLDFCNNLLKLSTEYEQYLLSIKNLEDDWLSISEARKISKVERIGILAQSNKKPEKTTIQVTVFKRNIYVIAETLERASGICERCRKPAPFIKDKDETEYLEVHHIIPLAEDGDDSVENTIALCPNCHRHAHYGKKTYSYNYR